MAYANNDDLKRACETLRIRDVWAAAFADGTVAVAPPQRDGLTESPFREDGKRGSFSICHDGHGFKDFGGDGLKGGVWKFHELCWPSLTKGERAKALLALAERHGFTPTRPLPPAAAAPGASAVDPAVQKAADILARKDRARQLEEQAWENAEKGLRAPPPKKVEPWPECVARAYAEGLDHLRTDATRAAKLAEERGWPVAWVHELAEMGLVAYPWERWARPGEKWAARQKAFPVHVPRAGQDGAIVSLVEIGYHQRFFEPASATRPEHKGWLYLPSFPRKAPRSAYEEQLVAHARALGLDWDEHRSPPALVPPLPFVMGDLHSTPRLVVLLEGQWDAITFFGACGWFHDTTPPAGVLVFGIRGAQGLEAFLSYWGPFLEKWKPRAWAIADNDAAGGTWREPPPAPPGMPRPPSFADKLVAAGCRDPKISWLKRNPARPADKDFNDFYRAAKPAPQQMASWMAKIGICDRAGAWL